MVFVALDAGMGSANTELSRRICLTIVRVVLADELVGSTVMVSVEVSYRTMVVVGPSCSVRADKIEAVALTELGGEAMTVVKVNTE